MPQSYLIYSHFFIFYCWCLYFSQATSILEKIQWDCRKTSGNFVLNNSGTCLSSYEPDTAFPQVDVKGGETLEIVGTSRSEKIKIGGPRYRLDIKRDTSFFKKLSIFRVHKEGKLTLENIQVVGRDVVCLKENDDGSCREFTYGGGITIKGGIGIFKNCLFRNIAGYLIDSATESCGGTYFYLYGDNGGNSIYIQGGHLSISNSIFEENKGYLKGGALRIEQGSANIANSKFIKNIVACGERYSNSNSNAYGGAIYVSGPNPSPGVHIYNSTFSGNSAPKGHCNYCQCTGSCSCACTTYGSNYYNKKQNSCPYCVGAGGAIAVQAEASVIIELSDFNNNDAKVGGAIHINNENSNVTLVSCTTSSKIEQNTDFNGGILSLCVTTPPNNLGDPFNEYKGDVIINSPTFTDNVYTASSDTTKVVLGKCIVTNNLPCSPFGWYNCTDETVGVSCSGCDIGYIINKEINSVGKCIPCPKGKYMDEVGKFACKSCPKGTSNSHFGQPNKKSCINCTVGTFAQNDGSEGCSECMSGMFNDEIGKPACKVCKGGQYQSKKKQTTCDPCNPGKYLSPSNERSAHVQKAQCISCKPGRYQTAQGGNACVPCAAGKYGIEEGGTKPSVCNACTGNTFSKEASGTCSTCANGKVQQYHQQCLDPDKKKKLDGTTPTIIALYAYHPRKLTIQWKLSPKTNRSMITKVVGTVTDFVTNKQDSSWGFELSMANATGATTGLLPNLIRERVYTVRIYIQFQDGRSPASNTIRWETTDRCSADNVYLNTRSRDVSAWQCDTCPKGAFCRGNIGWKQVQAKFGYWRDKHNDQFYSCINAKACHGMPEFHEGCWSPPFVNNSRLCSACMHGYARGSYPGSCSRCHPSRDLWILLLSGVIATILTVYLIKITVFVKGTKTFQFSQGVKKIALSYLQFAALASKIHVPWNQTFRNLFSFQRASISVSQAFLSLDCVFLNKSAWEVYQIKLFIALLFPLLVSPIAYVVITLFIGGNKKHIIATIVLLWYLAFPTIVQKLTALVICTGPIGPNNLAYFQLDPNIPCWKDTHINTVLTVGIFGFVFYVIGLPILSYMILKRLEDLELPDNRVKYGILYDGYSKEFWWWEIVVVSRKFSIILIGSLMTGTMQILSVLLCVAFVILITAFAQPFADARLFRLELLSLSVIYFTFWVGSALASNPKCSEDDNGGEIWCELAAYGVIIFNIVGGFMLAYHFGTAKWKEKGSIVIDTIYKQKCCYCCYNRRKRRDSQLEMESLLNTGLLNGENNLIINDDEMGKIH